MEVIQKILYLPKTKENTNVKLWLMVFLALHPVSSLRRQVRADLGVNLVI